MSIPIIKDIYNILFNEDAALTFLIEKRRGDMEPKVTLCQIKNEKSKKFGNSIIF
jgi:hypothetical protein